MGPTALERFNSADAADAERLLRTCVDVPRWAAELAAARPFADVDAAVEAASAAARPWTDAELDQALGRHPRIGERPPGDDAEARLSRQEQAAVDPADDDVRRRFAEGNRAYEERFGRVFLIRAAGRTAEELLGALEERLTHDPADERAIVADELLDIALLRLRGALSSGALSSGALSSGGAGA
ncbi:2-oxo-4-hydroxy-4-carboxy-5-ureidoimidazoline decarboxylase [Cellulomonas fimi]|uniref:2-oxo-4-hydroxy-4-carboxy-5-ureidoimidazoline decarboxylase n=1 Tax=Cellulomonas fimi TaxID=1708 RepID=A0A7Y0LYR1_CELFI|nr:2-oxo-4-hydroxy-4-carboxy-5-ureidoimidazoline decarboxylase [Cellulomonas fimi]NMR20682.1 2-oxo-4-hydroxy-4-carboxy-5-ureidoimidazoline decarboxylase [Cellulomonas fimi]